MSLPYYRRYPRDFFEGTALMPLELKGAYGLVLDMIYMHRGELPDDPRYISGNLGCSVRKWNSIRKSLIELGKLKAENEIISNFRADKEEIILRTHQDKQAENARGRNKNNGLQKPPLNQSEPEPIISKDIKKTKAKKEIEILADVLGFDGAQAVYDHRKKLRKPLTVRAAELLAIEFSKTSDPNDAANQMIMNGWQGFKASWAKEESTNQPASISQQPKPMGIAEMAMRQANQLKAEGR